MSHKVGDMVMLSYYDLPTSSLKKVNLLGVIKSIDSERPYGELYLVHWINSREGGATTSVYNKEHITGLKKQLKSYMKKVDKTNSRE